MLQVRCLLPCPAVLLSADCLHALQERVLGHFVLSLCSADAFLACLQVDLFLTSASRMLQTTKWSAANTSTGMLH